MFKALSLPGILAIFYLLVLGLAASGNAYALPLDWNGVFATDLTHINTYKRTPEGANGEKATYFHTYTFKLRPTLIVNDAASIFGEFTTGYASGGHFGEGAERSLGVDRSVPLYNYNTSRTPLHLSQLYAKYYADTATYIVGRQPLHWGLGALFNSGGTAGNRYSSVEDGIVANLDIGNFQLSPYYMRANDGGLNDNKDLISLGIKAMYDNNEQGFSIGLLYGTREGWPSPTFPADDDGSPDMTIIDFYLQKTLGDIDFKLEIPVLTGSLNSQSYDDYDAKAFIGEASYELSPSWKFSLNGGYISGENASTSKFEGMYLHPNYHIAHLMFRYNTNALHGGEGESLFDSYMTNATFAKALASYYINQWAWNMSVIWASASEVARGGASAFNHERNKVYSAGTNQKDDYGFEVDLDFVFNWSSDVALLGSFGYHFVGDYYAHIPEAQKDTTPENAYVAQFKTVISF